MSKRRKSKKINPIQLRAMKQAATCPDCDSVVKIKGKRIDVTHDDTCPSLAMLMGNGLSQPSGVLLVRASGEVAHVAFGHLVGTDIPAVAITATPYRQSHS